MSKKMARLCALIAAAMLLLTGCAGTKPAAVSGDWEIGLSLLTDSPTFYTRNQDGTTMGVIAMRKLRQYLRLFHRWRGCGRLQSASGG